MPSDVSVLLALPGSLEALESLIESSESLGVPDVAGANKLFSSFAGVLRAPLTSLSSLLYSGMSSASSLADVGAALAWPNVLPANGSNPPTAVVFKMLILGRRASIRSMAIFVPRIIGLS